MEASNPLHPTRCQLPFQRQRGDGQHRRSEAHSAGSSHDSKLRSGGRTPHPPIGDGQPLGAEGRSYREHRQMRGDAARFAIPARGFERIFLRSRIQRLT
jgi:hypothetical protein